MARKPVFVISGTKCNKFISGNSFSISNSIISTLDFLISMVMYLNSIYEDKKRRNITNNNIVPVDQSG